jgi:hypothetical protein
MTELADEWVRAAVDSGVAMKLLHGASMPWTLAPPTDGD